MKVKGFSYTDIFTRFTFLLKHMDSVLLRPSDGPNFLRGHESALAVYWHCLLISVLLCWDPLPQWLPKDHLPEKNGSEMSHSSVQPRARGLQILSYPKLLWVIEFFFFCYLFTSTLQIQLGLPKLPRVHSSMANKHYCYGLDCVPLKFVYWSLIPQHLRMQLYLEIRAWKVIKTKWDHMGGP